MTTHDRRLLELHNLYQGSSRILILGNGPSLLKQDLRPLEHEWTFACNGFPKWKARPFEPNFYGVSDIKDAKYFEALGLDSLVTPFRFNVQFESRRDVHDGRFIWVEKAPDNIQIHSHGTVGMGPELPPIPTGRTTPLTLAQIALWLGFRSIYFLGVEQTTGYVYNPKAQVTMQGAEMDRSERYLKAIQKCFLRFRQEVEEQHGGYVADCTPDGFLTGHTTEITMAKAVLPYVPLSEALSR